MAAFHLLSCAAALCKAGCALGTASLASPLLLELLKEQPILGSIMCLSSLCTSEGNICPLWEAAGQWRAVPGVKGPQLCQGLGVRFVFAQQLWKTQQAAQLGWGAEPHTGIHFLVKAYESE